MAKEKNKDQESPPGELSYFQQRMKQLGISPDVNKIELYKYDAAKHENVLEETPIFQEVEEGIKILVYTLDRHRITFESKETRIKDSGHEVLTGGSRYKKEFSLIRLKNPIEKGNDVIKYKIPKGGGTYPFFPPSLIDKYERKIPMKTVYLTEGYFKAFKGSMHGVDIIGLSSITHMKDKETGALHSDIVKLIKSGLVERFVWLTDGDCLDITQKEITEEKDLYTRPRGFFASVTTFKTLLEDYEIEKWFMHIDTDVILQNGDIKNLTRDKVKGLDDLLITYAGRESEVVSDLLSMGSGFYFRKFNVTYGTHQVWRHFHLSNVNDFFLYHVERRPELKKKEFKFIGTRYLYNEEEATCKVMTPGEASLYFRVGDNYYKFIEIPNQHNHPERVFQERKKTTIMDDWGKNFTKHIPKYEAFCNVPHHSNFQQVIHNCFNVYSPIEHHPDEDECFPEDFPNIMNMVRHIFGEKKVSYTDGETRQKKEYLNYELGLDYLQLLYQQPSQKLPILCLVSRENGTGKSMLGFFLREMLGANVAIVGNADIAGEFNAHWSTKTVVICDEAKIDKQTVIEKIKALSTARKIFMNAKGRGQVELDCFIKFIMMTNNEENFIYANDDDERYWVLKVPVLSKDNPHFLSKLVEEIPAFLSFLTRRKLATEEKSRMWFHFHLLRTEALRKVIQYSQPTIEKELRSFMKEMFLDTGLDEILMTLQVVHKEVFNNKYERNYLASTLSERMKLQQFHVWEVDGLEGKQYKYQDQALAVAEQKFPDAKGHMLLGKIKPKYKPIRYSYPRYEEVNKDGHRLRERLEIKEPPGRPYVFKRGDFVTDAEDRSVEINPEDKFISTLVGNEQAVSQPADPELPF